MDNNKTVVVTLTDAGYFSRAKRTIIDVRSRGEWTADLVLITVGFDAPRNFLDYYKIIFDITISVRSTLFSMIIFFWKLRSW